VFGVVDQVDKILKGLEKLLKDKVEEESADLLQDLTDQLKKLDKQSIDKVLDKVLKDNINQFKKSK